jgi:2-polyprenyl-3-methyl-5-hydroxy-6-metoxy-1,4-benzoquinol methylase
MRFIWGKKRRDHDLRPHVSKDMTPEEFARIYDLTFQYRERVLPEAFTLKFWEDKEAVRLPLERGLLRNDILDVGCGSGEIDIILGMKGYRICGLDISPYAIEIANRHLREHPELATRVRFVTGDIEDIELKDRFNTALIYHTLEHVMNPHRTLEKTIRFLNPGAKIMVEVPYKKAYRDRTHLRIFSPRSLKRLLTDFSNRVDVTHFRERRTIFAVVEF